ncbi:hypothetical protein ACFE04_024476 [Oxalis oulophora]
MAADVSCLVRVMNGYKDNRTVGNESGGGKSSALITRDLLGGGGVSGLKNDSQELDLDLQVPNGWEKRLDLKSGKVYLQRCNSSNSSSSSENHHKNHFLNQTILPKFQDLNFPPSQSKPLLNLFDETTLDLKLVSSTPSPSSSSANFQSVCTLDKVKSALERAEKEPVIIKKRSSMLKSSSISPTYSSSSSSIKDGNQEEEDNVNNHKNRDRVIGGSPIAAGCPGCLSYVLIMKNNPKCPRCHSDIPMPMVKKPRIDLNISM